MSDHDDLLRYKYLFDNVLDVYAEIRPSDGRILEITPSIERITRYTRKELLGTSIIDLYVNKTERTRLMRTLITEGKIENYTVHLHDKDERIVPCSFSAQLISLDESQEPIIIGTMRDITELEEARKKEQEAYKLYQSLIETTVAGIGITDLDENFMFFNQKLADMLGYGTKELSDSNLKMIVSASNYVKFQQKTNNRRQGKSETYETQLKKRMAI